ncbi:MAG TPA: DUF721 domain-containing protein [bacterium]|jgi:predicted nucleic acid-binding Zn ribbon protein
MKRRRITSQRDQITHSGAIGEEPDSALARQRTRGRKGRPFPFTTLSAAIQKAVNTPVMKRRLDAIPIAREWRAIVGEAVAEHIQPSALEKGILTLEADSSVWRQQISFEKKELLAKITARFKDEQIKEIRVK